MYRGFNLTNLRFNFDTSDLVEQGRERAIENRQIVKDAIDAFVMEDGSLDGSQIQQHWFPQIQADVFISHSHNDEELALAFAGWLENFGLRPFIDHSVWGYANKLLKRVDDKYCLNPGEETYSYDKRNGSTSHVHMMLTTALGMMIDRTECLIFLNTSQSITASGATLHTNSPWLFAEIAMARMVRRTIPQRPLVLNEYREKTVTAGARIKYEMDLSHLSDITVNTLTNWQNAYNHAGHPLDALYEVT